jgi:flagellar biosynthesis protein FlhF
VMGRADTVIDTLPASDSGFSPDNIARLLDFHGVTDPLKTELQNTITTHTDSDLLEALTQALDLSLRFRPLSVRVQSSVLLIGQPGQGKTLTALRLAASAHAAKRRVQIITLDADSAGAMAQMESFCTTLNIPLHAMTLAQTCAASAVANDQLTIIDTTGFNPYVMADIQATSRIVAQTRIEPVWVTACGADSGEFLEQSRIFRELGVQRLIATRADSCRRFGALLNLLGQSSVALAGMSVSPFMSEPILTGAASTLARKLVATPVYLDASKIEKNAA